ncbi:MAG: hypothetical protein LBR52_04700 [Prevotellaceae bacterium]|jgi:hypothetical protein|nr:hypothetical protein [Prevotellaceae bacterium]
MAREIRDINRQMLEEKAGAASLAGLTSNSSASIWRTLFYIVATAIHTLEKIFDLHRQEITETIENIIPHRPKWYRDMALKFMKDKVLIDETDRYDTSGMTEADIEAARIVKYATAVELNGNLVVKIATGATGNLEPIPADYLEAFETYMNEVRDAGVKVSVINQAGDEFSCELKIFYDSILVKSEVEKAVKEAILSYITGLPFNGEYSNMALVDAVQAVEGVKVASFIQANSAPTGYTALAPINSKTVPAAGYFTKNATITLNLQAYEVGQQL